MEKYLITGFSGFVSKHFIDYLEKNNINANVIGVDIMEPNFTYNSFKNIKCHFEKANLLDKDKLLNIIYHFQPDYILHLASFSSVAYSWKEPIISFTNNTNIFLNLIEIIRSLNIKCRILSIGSSEEYGNVTDKDLPLKENMQLNPISPYAVARVSQEFLSKVYVTGYGIDIVMTRSFNHIGPFQNDIFVIPSFVKQMLNFKNNNIENGELITGDISIIRDFIDIRDVVEAYYFLFKKGIKGEVYNVCSSNGISLENIILMMTKILEISVKIQVDKNLIRPNDNIKIIGSNEKLINTINWSPKYSTEQSIKDIIKYWDKL